MLVSRESPKEKLKNVYATPILGSEASDEPIPQFSLLENPLDPEIPYQLIKDDLIDEGSTFIGTSTVGSSEACMLGGLAMKFAWRKRAKAKGMDVYTKKPNLVISSGYQVCWEKFCVYWDIEMRLVPLDEKHMSLNLDLVLDCVDDYTIGVVAVMGITYTGKYDDVEGLDQILEEYNKSHDLPVYIHVDGASGLFIAG